MRIKKIRSALLSIIKNDGDCSHLPEMPCSNCPIYRECSLANSMNEIKYIAVKEYSKRFGSEDIFEELL